MRETVYTVGYTAFDRETMLNTLVRLSVDCLIDVRSVPMSAHAPEFNRPEMERVLRERHMYYRNYAEFGARQTNRAYYTNEGWLDFDLYGNSEPFQNALKKVADGMRAGYRFALMCAEKDPIHCHRAILVARHFARMGYAVNHIRGIEQDQIVLESHSELEKRLAALCGDNLSQVSMFDSDEARIERAYRLQNREIAYRLEEEQP